MMKLASTVVVVLFHLLACARPSHGATMDVVTCADLQLAAAAAGSSDTVGVLTGGGVSCDAWTTFEVTHNKLKLVAPDTGFNADHTFVFENVRFLVSSGVLRVDPEVSFSTGASGGTQEVNGGALSVAEGGYVRFLSNAKMAGITILSVKDEGSDITSDRWYGGCIYNQGNIRFEAPFEADDCSTVGGGESAPGDGGGIFNGPTGIMVFKKELIMANCGTFDNEGNLGGAIRNEGAITVTEDAYFTDNHSAAGGAIDNTGVMKFLSNSLAIFSENGNYDSGDNGGQVRNSGTMKFNGGAVFEDGYSGNNGGAIGNTGTLTISKSAVFSQNHAFECGGAIASPSDATLELPSDTVFEGNYVSYPEYFDCGECIDWYQVQADGTFICLP